MKIKKGFNLRQIGNEHIIIASGTENVDFTSVISLNEPAARLWKEIGDREFTAEELGKLLFDWYEIDEATALEDARILTDSWIQAGIAER